MRVCVSPSVSDVTKRFCRENKVAMIVRSHQFVRQGYKVMHHGFL